MSRIADEITAAHDGWGPLPSELLQAWDWMEAQGYALEAPAGYAVTPYPGERQLGVVFSAQTSLDGWFPDDDIPAELLPIAEIDGTGSIGPSGATVTPRGWSAWAPRARPFCSVRPHSSSCSWWPSATTS